MARCGCASSSCACVVVGGVGANVSGDGSNASPYAVNFAPQPAKGAVAFTWDDGWSTHPDVATMHAVRGQRATFYITSNLLGTAQHMLASALPTIAELGHEIGCHNADHVDMTGLTPATRAAQWNSAATIEGLVGSGYKITSYAYPLGNNNLTCNQEAYGRFDRVAAIGLSQGYYTGASGYGPWLYEREFEGFKHGRFPWSQTTHAQFMQLLRNYVAKRHGLLSVYAHQIGNPDTPTLVQVTEALDFCQAAGIPCITEREMFPAPKIINPGFESGLDGWITITAGTVGNTAVADVIADAPATGLSGTNSLRITAPAGMTAGDSVHVFQTIPVRPNVAYSLSARIRHDGVPVGAGKFSVRINEYNEAAGTIAGRSVRGTASTGAWAQSSATPAADAPNYTVAGKTGPDTRYMTVGLYVQEYSGVFYADHVNFAPTEEGLLG